MVFGGQNLLDQLGVDNPSDLNVQHAALHS